MTSTPRLRIFLLGAVTALGACIASSTPPPNTRIPPSDPVAAAPPTTPTPVPQPPPPPPPVAPLPPPTPPTPPPVAPPATVPPVVGERRDDLNDRRFDRASDWDKLGERKVNGKLDRDVIKVGKKQRFRAIAVVVEHSALEMFDLVVTFGDGSVFSPPTRLLFDENSRSRVIDLPGEARVIKKVEFRYGNLPGGGKAQVELWGFDARNDDGDGRDGKPKGKGKGKGKGHGGDGSGAGNGGGGHNHGH